MRNFKKELEANLLFEKKLLQHDLARLRKTKEEYLTYSNRKFYRNYYSDGKRISKYISADEKRLLGYLLRRGVYKKRSRILQSNIFYEEKLLKNYTPYDQHSILEDMSAAYKVGFELLESLGEDKMKNAHATYEKYALFESDVTRWHTTIRGEKRRSKSEVIISNLLDEYRVRYQYEQPLYWDDDVPYRVQSIAFQHKLPRKILPDFTIELPDGQTIFWEHLGMLGEEDYRAKWADKQLFYFLQGINQGERLIVTCDSAEGTFNSGVAARIAEKLTILQAQGKDDWQEDTNVLF